MTNVSLIWPSVNRGENGESRKVMAQNSPSHTVDTGQDISRPQNAGESVQDISRPQNAGESVHAYTHLEETISGINIAITQLDQHILKIEENIEEVQKALRVDGECRGERGSYFMKEKDRLVRKEQQLREEKQQLREEKIVLVKADVRARTTNGDRSEGPQHRMSLIMTSACIDDPKGAEQEEMRLSRLGEIQRERRASLSGYTGDVAGTDAVVNVHSREEDPRLLVRLGAFGNPILVSTLVAGFTLVLFDVAVTERSRELAILSFGLEVTASIVLSLISFHGQQLYSHATDVKPLVRKFLRRMLPLTIFGLTAFSLGIVVFVVSFVLEASEDIGRSWVGVLGIAIFPTIIAGVLFVVSTVDVRRYSFPTE